MQQIVKRKQRRIVKDEKNSEATCQSYLLRGQKTFVRFRGTATTSLRAGETHSDEITERDQN